MIDRHGARGAIVINICVVISVMLLLPTMLENIGLEGLSFMAAGLAACALAVALVAGQPEKSRA